ncbi:MAG: hypothetical protein ACRCYU_21855 [Nocardioides sp.]
MATALENAVDALSDPAITLPDALRRLMVVSRRINADELSDWLRGELNGLNAEASVPTYRAGEHLPIKLHFDGPMHARSTMTGTAGELPGRLAGVMNGMDFREPVAELQALANGDDDPQLQLPMAWIGLYRQLAAQESVPSIAMYVLNRAGVMMPRTHLTGILDRIRSTALDLALSLEDVSPRVGSTDGPTVASEPKLAEQVHIHLSPIYANNSTVTVGDNATVASGKKAIAVHLETGDTHGLLSAAAAFLQADGLQALSAALAADGDQPGEATRWFLTKVRSGAVLLASGVATSAAYDGILGLIQQVFPGALS